MIYLPAMCLPPRYCYAMGVDKVIVSRMNRMNRMARVSATKQNGVALAVSLILLVAITVVVLAAMSGSKLNEKVASNSQQKAISFEAAESSIGTYWVGEAVRTLLRSDDIMQFNNPGAITPPGSTEKLSRDFDQMNESNTALVVDITGELTFQYCGETLLPKGNSLNVDESDRQMVGTMFDINAATSLAGSHAKSNHLQRGYIMSPKTGRTGSCTTPNN